MVSFGYNMKRTTIKATCSACNADVKLDSSQVLLRICVDNNQGSYCFRCPECKLQITKPASDYIVGILKQAEIQVENWALPLELSEPHPIGDPIELDDVLTMHELLESDNWFDQL